MNYVEDYDGLEIINDETSVEDHAAAREKIGMFCQSALEMPPRCRRVFLMAKVYGMSYKEIAAELNIGTSVIEKHVAKGLEICHAYMQRMEDPEQQNPEQQKTAAKQYEQSSTVNNIEELIARQLGGQDKR